MRMCLQPCKSLDLAPSDRSEMSAIPPLLGRKQTWRRHAKIDVNDPERTS
jgi:hypothetical protein